MEPRKRIDGGDFYLSHSEPTFELANELYSIVDKHRDYLKKWLSWAFEKITARPEDSYSYLKSRQKSWEEGINYGWSIHLTKTDEIIGNCGTVKMGKNSVEFGTWVSPEFAGHGFGSRAKKLLEEEFSNLGIERFTLSIDTENTSSLNGAKRLGYEFEGVEKYSFWTESFQTYRDIAKFAKIIKKIDKKSN